MKSKVDGHSGLYKDEETGVIVNRSNTERDRYRIAKEQALKNLTTQEELQDLKSEMEEIKKLLKDLTR